MATAAPGFGLTVLNVISTDPFDEKIRLAAAVHFKNHVRSRWTPSSSDNPPSQTPRRTRSKPSLSPPCSKSPAASVLNSPKTSPSSVPMTSPCPGPPSSLSSSPTSAPPPTIPPSMASSAPPTPSCSSFATPPTPPPSASTSSTASTASPPPLPDVFIKAAQFISANATASSPDVLCPFFECQRLSCRIFYSLNSTEFPEFFDDPMRGWMT